MTAIIVDDEPYSCETLQLLLTGNCSQIEVVGICLSGSDAIKAIETLKPDLVFLDIEMPDMNAFELLQKLPSIDFHVIFTTSYDRYAIKAIRFSALDYLLKPIDRLELQAAVKKAVLAKYPVQQQLEVLFQKLSQPVTSLQRIALPTLEGLQLLPVESILYCRSDSNYTILHLKNKQKVVVSKTLKDVEEMLIDHAFCRVHHSYMVNLNEIEKFVKGDAAYVVLSNGSVVDVSRSRKESLLERLQKR